MGTPYTPQELAALGELQRKAPRAAFVTAAAFKRLAECMFAEAVDVPGRLPPVGRVYARITPAGAAYAIVPEAADAR